MAIVDFHIHPVRYQSMTPSYHSFLRKQWGDGLEEIMRKYASPGTFLGLMDECGIDFAVILAEIAPVTTGIADNESVAEFCSVSPRLIPFASVNPHTTARPDEELRRLVEEGGFRGLKLYPSYQQYYPNDPRVYPLYARAQSLGIPVLLHMGSSVFAGSRLKYANPLYLDDVAVDFPELVLIQSHSGRPIWYETAFTLARLHANVFMEVAGLPPQKLLTYFPELERLADKVIYGSDWPGVPTIRENIQAIRELPIAEDAKRKILGDNAVRVLGSRERGVLK
jgi:predicted TIM-barrel fold metal-dependent hydrolase